MSRTAFFMLPGLLSAAGGEPAAPQALFNGKDLSGFHSWLVDTKRADPRGVFGVSHGMIHISGDGLGYLRTEKQYADYELIAEFKWGARNWKWGERIGKARDSGIFLHATGPDGNSHDGGGAFMAGIECNLFEGATGDFLLIRGDGADGRLIAPRLTATVADGRDSDGWFTWKSAGRAQTIERMGRINWSGKSPQWRDVTDFRGANDVERAAGEWNTVVCVCAGPRITIKVNGTVVNEATEVRPRSGHILLQCEGSEIWFRRLELKPLRVADAEAQNSKE